MDAISLLTPHTKAALRPYMNSADAIISAIQNAYRICWYGRPGPAFVDLPTDFIMTPVRVASTGSTMAVQSLPGPVAPTQSIKKVIELLIRAEAPLVIVGKGAAYARAERPIRELIETTNLPFLPTPMGKGVLPDSHPSNVSSARSLALKGADVVLLIGARLNWILHHGSAPKYRKDVKFVQIDISAEELGKSNTDGQAALSIFGDITAIVAQLNETITASGVGETLSDHSKSYLERTKSGSARNEQTAYRLATKQTQPDTPLSFERAFHIIKDNINLVSDPSNGEVVYIGEGSQTMDISRSIFPLEHPRQKLDAGTYATMGVGLAYCIASFAAYNLPRRTKKIVAFEGDSAFGFAGMEVSCAKISAYLS